MKRLLLILLLLGTGSCLFAQTLELTRPAGGTIWPAYSIQRIEWSSANVDNIKIESSLDSGRTWSVIINSYPASAQLYEWEIPNKISDSCFIRISDVTNATISSSNYKKNPFKIPPPGIVIDTLPASVQAGTVLPISWTSSGIKKLNLYISYGNRNDFVKIADTVPATVFYYNWQVPSSIASQCFVKAEDASQAALSDTTKLPFEIVRLPRNTSAKFKGGAFDGHTAANNKQKNLTLLSPGLADSVFGNTRYSIAWKQNNTERVNIYFSADSGATWQMVVKDVSAATLKYDWVVPALPTNTGKIKIEDATDSSFYTVATNLLVIKKKMLRITYPDTSLVIRRNTVLPIGWNSGGVNNVRIKIWSNNKDTVLIDSLPASVETYNWVIPGQLTNDLQVVLVDKMDSTVTDTSRLLKPVPIISSDTRKFKGGSFDGHTAGSNKKALLRLLYPNGSEELSVLNNYQIKWRSDNIERVALDFSVDSGGHWSVIDSNLAASAGVYNWKSPNMPSRFCLLRVRDNTDATVFDISDTTFALLPKKIKNTTDSTGWIRGTAKSIEWQPSGVEWVRVQYKTAVNQRWQVLRDSLPGGNEVFNWIVPASITDSLWIMVSDATDSTVSDTKPFFNKMGQLINSYAAIKYHGGSFDGHSQRSNINKVIIKHPAANEILVGGTQFEITWNAINLEDSVLLQYSIDSGATWATITRTVARNGSYIWTVPLQYAGKSFNGVQYGGVKVDALGMIATGVLPPSDINSSKCQIRVLDILSGNVLVGTSSNTFTIQSSSAVVVKQKDTISFPQPADMAIGQAAQQLKASSVSKRAVKYLVASGDATLNGDLLMVNRTGKVKVGAYINGDATYLSTDTLYATICVSPLKPTINYKGSANLCYADTAILIVDNDYPQYSWSTGATTKKIAVYTASAVSIKVGDAGCYSASSDTLIFLKDTTKEVRLSVSGPATVCSGDSVILISSAVSNNQWYREGIAIAGAVGKQLIVSTGGNYTVTTTNLGQCSIRSANVPITVKPKPVKPIISRSTTNNDLLSNLPVGNQWYLDSIVLPGAIQQAYKPIKSGYYSLKATLNGCTSEISDPYYYVVTAILNVGGDHYVRLNPNPVSDALFITHNLPGSATLNMSIFDLSGKRILQKNNLKSIERIDMSGYPGGVYVVRFYDSGGKINIATKILKL